jgi:arylsulfatase A-like enzyme
LTGQFRHQIDAATSAVDLLPTLLHVSGENPADWAEGVVLPPFAPTAPDPQRAVYALHPKENDPDKALTHGSVMMVRGKYKLTCYFGYEQLANDEVRVELYDIQSD